jgi:hypothetical protein
MRMRGQNRMQKSEQLVVMVPQKVVGHFRARPKRPPQVDLHPVNSRVAGSVGCSPKDGAFGERNAADICGWMCSSPQDGEGVV